jgi:alpha-tubulin suppressor-like RCC1 family protein
LRFRQISTGVSHTCGVTTTDLAYCWGNNGRGQLGDGTTSRRLMPVRVMGGLAFREIATGTKHTCGVTTGNVVYCWGDNASGQLGSGIFGGLQLMPRRIAGTLQFRQLSAGSQHTCASSPTNRVFCWGLNNLGQLGDGTNTNRARATRVMSDQFFSRVDAGRLHSCAVNLDSQAYCWGDDSFFKLGANPTGTADTRVPLAVTGGLRFRQLDGGSKHSCGVTPGNLVKCWGNSNMGQLGNGSQGNSLGPTRTAIDLQARQIATGFDHTCAVTLEDRAFCWGSNDEGELGVGTTLFHTIATPVGGRPADSPLVVVRFRSEQNGSVNPAVDTVAVGTKMTWIWSGGTNHNVTSTGSPTFPGSALFVSGTGKQYAVTFTARGSYTYHCSLHEGMTGRILVR